MKRTRIFSFFAILLATVMFFSCSLPFQTVAKESSAFEWKLGYRYVLDSENEYILKVRDKTPLSDFLEALVSPDMYRVYKDNKEITQEESTILGTGTQVEWQGSTKQTAVILIKGDINGDGKVSSLDYLRIKLFFDKKYEFDELRTSAADVNDDGWITSTDYLRIKYYLGGRVDLYSSEMPEQFLNAEFETPKNIILMIGDGMGFNHLNVARELRGGNFRGNLFMDYFPIEGKEMTSSLSGITDSAAAATALACGYKTKNSYVGVDKNGSSVTNIRELAQSLGMKTGVITNKFGTDATPAGFTAHTNSRSNQDIIARHQLMDLPDVFIVGNSSSYDNALKSSQVQTKLNSYGVERLYTNATMKNATGDRVFATINELVDLEASTRKALEVLNQSEDGFFLMVEGGLIDNYSHANEIDLVVDNVMEFDRAVGAVMEFMLENPDTLLIVTADHETGGLQYLEGQTPVYKFTSSDHTNALCPIFAAGIGVDLFDGASVNNIQIPKVLASILGEENFGQ